MPREDAFVRQAEHDGVRFLFRLDIIKLLDEQEVCELLDDFERVRDASRPENLPDAIDLVPFFSLQHARPAFLRNSCS